MVVPERCPRYSSTSGQVSGSERWRVDGGHPGGAVTRQPRPPGATNVAKKCRHPKTFTDLETLLAYLRDSFALSNRVFLILFAFTDG